MSCDWPRLLIVTGFEPGNQHVGAILTSQILNCLPDAALRTIVVAPRGTVKQSPAVTLLNRKFEYSYRPIRGRLGQCVEYFAHRVLFQNHVGKLIEECVKQGREHHCDGILVVLESPTLIALAERSARRLNVPLYCFVMDGPRHLCQNYGYCQATSDLVLRQFHAALHQASAVAVSGESMKEAYDRQYGTNSVILRQGVRYQPPVVDRRVPPEKAEIRIGFAGSVTAPDAYDSLLAELQRRHWELAGKQVVMRFVGAHLKLVPNGPMNIEYLGWRSVQEMIRLMSECDILYLPQPFSEGLRECAELSFPNKLCTYLPARRPIALHAPAYASLHAFYRRFPCGPVSTELRAADILEKIAATLNSEPLYEASLENVETAFATELNQERLRQAVHAFLGSR